MKIKLLIAAGFLGLTVACGGQSPSSGEGTSQTNPGVTPPIVSGEVAGPKGKTLIANSDCMSCHADKNKIIGPSYLDIAAKYTATPENVKLLAGKIIKGGQGVWGEIPMTAHPQISQADAEEMVSYILSIK